MSRHQFVDKAKFGSKSQISLKFLLFGGLLGILTSLPSEGGGGPHPSKLLSFFDKPWLGFDRAHEKVRFVGNLHMLQRNQLLCLLSLCCTWGNGGWDVSKLKN